MFSMFAMKRLLDRHAAPNQNSVTVVDPQGGPGRAERAEETTQTSQGRGRTRFPRQSAWLVCLVLLAAAAPPVHVGAQGLADIARREEARRKTAKPARKVYTNGDLRSDSPSTPPATAGGGTPAPALPGAATPAPGAKPDTAAAADTAKAAKDSEPAKDQAYWGDRMRTARSALDRSKIFGDALQSRINALSNDFVNRDDPAQRAQIELERQRAVAELERVKREMAEQTKAIADIEEEARRAGVPPGWLR